MAKVFFKFEDKNEIEKEVTGKFIGLSIHEVAEDFDIHINHNCGNVCACSTCHVYINKGDEHLQELSDREEDFIDRAINPRLESRLSCQAIILDEEAEVEVLVPDQSAIIGHEH